MSLAGKYAFVTGGSQGIGKAICLELASQGANVAINYHSHEDLAIQTKEEVEALGVSAILVPGDVADFEQTKEMFNQVIDSFGCIDILVNNAGITKDALMLRMKESDFDSVIDINLKGTWNCMKHASRYMMKQRSGVIISISSIVGIMGNAGQVNYSASKAGIIGMTKSLARELGGRGVRVNAVAPGFIQTAMTDKLDDKIKASMLAGIPLGSFGSANDVAKTVAFLASDDAKYITGQVIHVDGGMAM